MKRILLIIILGVFCLSGFSQVSLFRPVPKHYFATKALGVTTAWLPRINVGLNAISYGKNPETKQLEVKPLSAICFGLGMLHYKNVEGQPFNDFGLNLMYLQLTDKVGSGVGLYVTYNTGQIGLLNVGTHYDFTVKQFFVDTGVAWHF